MSVARAGRWFFGVTALAASGWLVAAPTDSLDDCAAGTALHVGIKDLAAACPKVEETIVGLGLDRILLDGWRERLNSRTLADLSNLVLRYQESQRQAAPRIDSLQPILQSMRPQVHLHESWWDGVKRRFRDWLQTSDSALAKWLNDWLERFDRSKSALDIPIYIVTALIVIGAAIVVIREVRAGRLARKTAGDTRASAESNISARMLASEVSPLTGVRGLLQSLVNRLQTTGRLAAAGSLTHRELVVRSVFDSETQRAIFAGIARKAESLMYGPTIAAQDDAENLAAQGYDLLAQLSNRHEAP